MTINRLQRFESFTNTDLVVRIPVTFEPGAPFNTLAGAVVDTRAQASDGSIVLGEAQIEADNTTIIAVYRRGTLPPGVCQCQVWVQVGQQAAMPFIFEAEVKPGFRPVSE